jgi:PST family polysaccharide transporter
VALGFLFFWQLARAMSSNSLGEYLYILAVIGYYVVFIDFGFNLFVLNTVPRATNSARSTFLRTVLSKLFLTFISFFILIATTSIVFGELPFWVVFIFFVSAVFQSFSGLFSHFYTGLGRFDMDLFATIVNSLLPVAIVYFFRGNMTLCNLTIIIFIVRLIVLFFQSHLFLKITSGQKWLNKGFNLSDLVPLAISDLIANFKFAVFSILGAIYLSIDVVIMRHVLGEESVSVYGVAMKVVLAMVLFFEVLNSVFLPSLVQKHESGAKMFKQGALRFLSIMSALGVSFTIILFFFGAPLIELVFGSEYNQAANLIPILSIALFFRVLTMINGSFLTVCGLQSSRAKVMTVVLPLHIIFNLLFQNYFGIKGAAGALAISFAILFLLNSFLFFARRQSVATCLYNNRPNSNDYSD